MYLNSNKNNIIKKDLVLLGAGHSNIEVLRYFGKNPINGIRLTLINNSYTSTYSGMVPGFISGVYSWNEVNIDLVKLCNNFSHRLVIAKISKINTKTNTVYLHNRPEIKDDFLSINLGIKSNTDDIEGAELYCIKLKPISLILSLI